MTLRAQQHAPQLAAAFAYVEELLRPGSTANVRLHGIAVGSSEKIELGDGAFVIEQVYATKARPDGFFESHRKYIDVQVIVAGEEAMEVDDIARLVPTMEFNPERDLIKYADTPAASRLTMRAGDVALFFPADGHMPSLRLGAEAVVVRKAVVKVPVY